MVNNDKQRSRSGRLVMRVLVGVAALGGACAVFAPPPSATTRRGAPARSAPAVRALGDGLRVTLLQTGTITIRRCHERPCAPEVVPAPVRLLRILSDSARTAPLPVVVGLIEDGATSTLVDAGDLRRFVDDPHYYDCDAVGGAVDHAIGRYAIERDDEVDVQLTRLGLAPPDDIVLTHLHFDHTGGVPRFPLARVWTSGIDHGLGSAGGAVTCRSLSSARLSFFESERTAAVDADVREVFGDAVRLSSRVFAVSLPGHTAASLGVLVHGTDTDVLFISDIAFEAAQVASAEMNGIHANNDDIRASMARIRAWSAAHPTIVIPTHDACALDRLTSRATFTSAEAVRTAP